MSRGKLEKKAVTFRHFKGMLESTWRLRSLIRSLRALRLARFDPLDGELDHKISKAADRMWP